MQQEQAPLPDKQPYEESIQAASEYAPVHRKISPGGNPETPLPETVLSSPLRSLPEQRQHLLLTTAIILALVIGSVILLPFLFTPSGSSLTLPSPLASDPIGKLSFTNSGQLDPRSSKGLNDVIVLSLRGLAQPHPGMSYYAWLLSDKTQDAISPILLGRFQGGNGEITYQNPQHRNLLASYSRFLVTEQASTAHPNMPPLDPKSWRSQGAVPDIPTPGDEQHFSLLSHMRHILADEPDLDRIGLFGGLNIWLYRNTGKILEWASAARDEWSSGTPDLLRRHADRIVEYLDGQSYAWQDLPPHTPWLVDPNVGHIGLIDVLTDQGQQGGIPSFISHVKLHLAGMVNAPDHTNAQDQLANKIDGELTTVEGLLKEIRSAAIQIARMDNGQMKSQQTLSMLNDIFTKATAAYIGQQDPMTGNMQAGVTTIHAQLQNLATIAIMATTPSGS